MPVMVINGAKIHFEVHGDGPETIVFCHGLVFDGRMFDAQVSALQDRYRCITFDFRGQGKSQVTASGYDLDSLCEDLNCLIQAWQCAPCHLVGLSMGGIVGMRLAIRRPELVRSLTLIETSADPESMRKAIQYRALALVARWFGTAVVADRTMAVMFGRNFLNDPTRARMKQEWRKRVIANDPVGISRALMGAVTRRDMFDQLDKISIPTLVLVGEQDVVYPPARAERIHSRIRGSKLVVIPNAGHTSTVEEPEAVNAALSQFLGDSLSGC